MHITENQETLVRSKAKELCSAMELKGWASTQFVPTPPYGYTLVSSTGCRAWFGKRWGMICDDMDDHLKIILDLPNGKLSLEKVSEQIDLPILNGEEEKSGIELIDNRDRDTLVIYLYTPELKEIIFKESKILELISDIRRMSCL
ncbi:hypothetical protein ACFPTR_04915 [Aliibacillus thermotolerans]|uniref:Uncharacterized protein n=1 Tax=Aliibacillus thermotolerans TaxID=1834418 RepID=A0ABW0U666_9BACI|nr:hypothetical protein [Aliibacillus thermotolerans]MDA3130111.1 hypothetical protein [Aliibacillus thermotolerans]